MSHQEFAVRLNSIRLFSLCLFIATPGMGRAQCRFQTLRHENTITYRFHPEITADSLVLHVTLEYKPGDKTSTLVVPTAWAGESLHAVTNLRVLSKGVTLENGSASDTKIVHARRNHPVVVSYDLIKDWKGPLIHPMQFHPVLLPEYFEFTGSNALVAPRLDSTQRITANFDWQGLPATWALATSFGTPTSTTDRCQTYTGPWLDVDQGLYTAGDYRIHRFQIGRRPAVLAIRGNWPFTDDEAITQIQKVVGTVRNFWHDDNFPYFLVTVKPYDQDHGSSDGSAFTNAFWMYLSRLDPLSGLLPQLAHESFHAWDPARMGSLPSKDGPMKWFMEGFTEYYAQLLTLKAGENSAANYVSSLNKDLRQFPVSDSEYVRGRVIALWLDATIRQESGGHHSLDDVMFDMVRGSSQPLTLSRIFDTAGRYLSAESLAQLRNAVTGHANLPAPKQLPAVDFCAHPTSQDLPTFDAGFDVPHSRASRTVTGVVPGGPAYEAGLRNGQSLNGRFSVSNGQPDKLVIVTIRTEDGAKEITFYPRGKTVAAWQYHLDASSPCQSVQ